MAPLRSASNQQIGLYLAVRDAGVELRMDEFDQRLVLQKAVYLLQSAKVHLGYQYRWHVRGPYCSALADDLFYLVGLTSEERTEFETYCLDPKSRQNIERVRSLFTHPYGELPRRLELLASALFLFRTGQAVPDDPEGTARVLVNAGKDFHAGDVRLAVTELTEHGLIQ